GCKPRIRLLVKGLTETAVTNDVNLRTFSVVSRGTYAELCANVPEPIGCQMSYPAIASECSPRAFGTRALTVVPRPGVDWMDKSPFTRRSRSRMLIRPNPPRFIAFCQSKPVPESLTVKLIPSVVPRT